MLATITPDTIQRTLEIEEISDFRKTLHRAAIRLASKERPDLFGSFMVMANDEITLEDLHEHRDELIEKVDGMARLFEKFHGQRLVSEATMLLEPLWETAWATYWEARAHLANSRIEDWRVMELALAITRLMEDNRWTRLASAEGYAITKHDDPTDAFWKWWGQSTRASRTSLFTTRQLIEITLPALLPRLDLSNGKLPPISYFKASTPMVKFFADPESRHLTSSDVEESGLELEEKIIKEIEQEGGVVDPETVADRALSAIANATQEADSVVGLNEMLRKKGPSEVAVIRYRERRLVDPETGEITDVAVLQETTVSPDMLGQLMRRTSGVAQYVKVA